MYKIHKRIQSQGGREKEERVVLFIVSYHIFLHNWNSIYTYWIVATWTAIRATTHNYKDNQAHGPIVDVRTWKRLVIMHSPYIATLSSRSKFGYCLLKSSRYSQVASSSISPSHFTKPFLGSMAFGERVELLSLVVEWTALSLHVLASAAIRAQSGDQCSARHVYFIGYGLNLLQHSKRREPL